MDSGSPIRGVRNDGGAIGSRRVFSDSIVKQPACKHAHSYRRDSSPPLSVRRGGGAFLPFALACTRERSAETALRFSSAPCGAARRVTGTRASRRSTAAIFHAVTVLLRRTGGLHRSVPGSIGAALHPIVSSHSRRPPQRGRTVTTPPGPWLRATDAGAAPCSVNQASLVDALD